MISLGSDMLVSYVRDTKLMTSEVNVYPKRSTESKSPFTLQLCYRGV